jgi:cation diffusion facilitator family transporter
MYKRLAKPLTTKKVLVTSLAVDVFNLVLGVAIALFTGSVVMLTAALQSFAELSSSVSLRLGRRYTNRRPTKLHPFGFGKEVYYWSTLATFTVIGIVAAVAFTSGYKEVLQPSTINHLWIAYLALGLTWLANAYSFWSSTRKLLEGRPLRELHRALLDSPVISTKTTAVLDVMGIMSSTLGLLSLAIYGITGNGLFDGLGAIAMGLILAISAVALLVSVRTLVTGQSAPPELERKIRDATREVSEVQHVLGMRTMMLSSDKLLVNIEVHLKDGLTTDQVEHVVEKVKQSIESIGESEGFRIHVEPDAFEEVHHDIK